MKGRGNHHRLPWPGITSRGQNLLVLPSTHENTGTRLSTTSCWQRYARGREREESGVQKAFKKSPPVKQIGGAEFSGFTPWSFTVRGKIASFLWEGKVVFEAWLKELSSPIPYTLYVYICTILRNPLHCSGMRFVWKSIALKIIDLINFKFIPLSLNNALEKFYSYSNLNFSNIKNARINNFTFKKSCIFLQLS